MRDFLRKLTPNFLLTFYRQQKKNKVNKQLKADASSGKIIQQSDLIQDLLSIGIKKGDTLLVHSSLSKIGYVEDGPKTVVNALLEVVGETGNLLMPNSPNNQYQADYIKSLSVFDVTESPSKLGSITEYFRKLPNAVRSAHPTEPVSCIGPDAAYFTSTHFGSLTPYTKESPFYKVSEKKGKILYIGVTLDNAGTNLHTLEDAVSDFKFPVYLDEIFDVQVKFPSGEIKTMQTKVHNAEQSKKRKCDGLIPLFESRGVLQHVKIGQAPTLLLDAEKMFQVMLDEYLKNGVTMYTPQGS